MKITKITITGMHKVGHASYDLKGDVNYFVGPNGAGKSTILEAIQLAILGYIPGYAKTNEGVMKHASGPSMTVTAELDSNITITRNWVRSGSSVKSNLDVKGYEGDISNLIGEIELPVFNFNEFRSMTSNKLKEWFINFLPSDESELDLKSELEKTASLRSLPYQDLLNEADTYLSTNTHSGVDRVKDLNAYFKEQQSFTKGQIAKLQGTIDSLIRYDDAPDYDEEEIRLKLSELSALKTQLINYDATENAQKKLKESIDELRESLLADKFEDDPRIERMQNDIVALNEEIQSIQDKYKTLQDQKVELVRQRASIPQVRGSVCPYSNKQCDTLANMSNDSMKKTEELDKKIAEVDKQIAASDIVVLKSKEANKHQVESNIEFIRNQYANLESRKSHLVELGERPSTRTLTSVADEVNQLQNDLGKVIANKRYEELVEQVTKDKFSKENDLEVLKDWIKLTDANNLQTKLMNKPFENLSGDMSKYLSAMFNTETKAEFNLSSKANSFSFGLTRGSNYIEFDYLSSGEKCLFTLALIMCILDKSNSELRLILVDDILDHLDTENADHLFKSLKNIDNIQFILAGVKECSENDMCILVKGD